ncbi:MAG: DUF896 domain-containing protein [Tissierellia bacterium]|nr:DUF896 domain-containing protein [Tissierellia bacterium]
MNPELISKINALAKKEKDQGLTSEEKILQKEYRDSYLEEFRKSFRKRLENIEITYCEEEQ